MSASKDPAQSAPGKTTNQSGAHACECHGLEQDVREVGKHVLDSTKGLREEIARQAQLHPLATVSVAFAAGLMIARALRR